MLARYASLLCLSLLLIAPSCCCPTRCPCPPVLDDVTEAPTDTAEPAEPAPPAQPAWPAAEARTMQEGHAPTPFTADQIRAGCPAGRVTKLRMEAEGAPQMIQVLHFVENHADGAVLEVSVTDTNGNTLSAPKRGPKQPWSALQSHASFPSDLTTISEETIETEGGSFACFLYTVTRSGADPEAVDQFWFAKALPGPPVLMRKSVGGKVVVKLELVANEVRASNEK